VAFGLLLGPSPAEPQLPHFGGEPTLNELAIDWARGRYASPVICQFGEDPVRGLRRVMISPGPAHSRPPVGRIVFVDLEIEEASRCFTELSGDSPNLIGSLEFRLPGSRRADTARRDFRDQIRRKKGFEFEIASGGLRVQAVSQPPSKARGVDFRGGRVSLKELDPASDRGRLLAGFDSPRKLLLEISARDGTKLSFPLYMTDLR
jgi:hypothetical protein